MKEILLFIMKGCPHCKLALEFQEEMFAAFPQFRDIPLRIVDEREEKEFADAHDYHYVPCYYVDGIKLHEGHVEQEDVEAVFRTALGEALAYQ